jgi:hypothetical protein
MGGKHAVGAGIADFKGEVLDSITMQDERDKITMELLLFQNGEFNVSFEMFQKKKKKKSLLNQKEEGDIVKKKENMN